MSAPFVSDNSAQGAAEEAVAGMRGLAERAKADVTGVQERLRSAQSVERFCSAVCAELEAGHSSEALRTIQGGSKALGLLREGSPESAAAVEEIGHRLSTVVEEDFGALVRSFPAAVRDAGLELDPASRHPNYTLLDGFLTVQFEKGRLETRVTPRDARRTTLGIDVGVVVGHLKAERDRLCGRPFDPAAVAGAIEGAYAAVVESGRRRAGDPVPLKDVVAELAKDKAFRADEFNIDLSRLVRSDQAGRELQLDHSRDAKNGLLLWQLDQRGYYGYIRIGGGPEAS